MEQALKNITVSDVEECADCPETIYNVSIDLVKLKHKESNFTKFNVQKEVSYQVGNFSGTIKSVILFGICQIQEVWQ